MARGCPLCCRRQWELVPEPEPPRDPNVLRALVRQKTRGGRKWEAWVAVYGAERRIAECDGLDEAQRVADATAFALACGT